ncbi:MAG: hypothetical protein ACRDQY_09780 [Pseudonocardiaceae bacterium]
MLVGVYSAAEQFPADLPIHSQRFGPDNTAAHVLATEGDLGRPRDVIRFAMELTSRDTSLPPTRIVDVHISTARAHLDLSDRDAAQTALAKAFTAAPQKAKLHPMSREVLRVLISLHRRSNPRLLQLATRAGLTG